MFGSIPRPTEKPFSTEAGPQAVDELYRLLIGEAAMLIPNLDVPPRRIVHLTDILQDVLNLMIGLPSSSFEFDKVSKSYLVEKHQV